MAGQRWRVRPLPHAYDDLQRFAGVRWAYQTRTVSRPQLASVDPMIIRGDIRHVCLSAQRLSDPRLADISFLDELIRKKMALLRRRGEFAGRRLRLRLRRVRELQRGVVH